MKLNEICEVYSGYALKAFNDAEDGLPVVKIGNILTDGTLNLEECQYTTDSVNEKYYSQRGDIYIALSGATTGKIGIMDTREKYVINQRVGIVRQKSDDVPQEYIKYFLLRQTDRILQEAAGCAQPNISPKQIAEYVIPDTSQEKMQEICEVLDRIKKIIDSRKAEISALDNLIKARFVEMFGDPVTNPKGLPIVALGELSELITKGASPSWQGFSYTDDSSQTIFVTSENVREGYIDLSSPKYIEDGFNEKQKRSVIHKGDFLINIVGASIGRAAQFNLDCKANMNQAAALVRVNDSRVRDKYLLTYLNSDRAQRMYDSMKSDTGRANLSLQDISDLLILLPNVEQQIEFEMFANQVDKSKIAVQKALTETQLLFDSLMQQYFG